MFHSLKHTFYPVLSLHFNFTSRKNPLAHLKMDNDPIKTNEKIYLSIDHLKKGTYNLNILLKNKIIKTIQFIKR